MPDQATSQRRARRVIVLGLWLALLSIGLILLPLVTGLIALHVVDKFVVAFGVIGLCLGCGLVLNGVIDWWRFK